MAYLPLNSAFYANPKGSFYKISITDNGKGISEDEMANIFIPFYTTKKLKGTGLGLANASMIIEENKGVFYLILGGLFFQLLFFVVNDVFSVVVYQKSDVNFWGWIVIASQIYNCCAVAYLVIKMTFSIFKNKNVEIIEKSDFESKEKEANESDIEDLNIDNENVETIKVIPTINIKTKTFDEEEIK